MKQSIFFASPIAYVLVAITCGLPVVVIGERILENQADDALEIAYPVGEVHAQEGDGHQQAQCRPVALHRLLDADGEDDNEIEEHDECPNGEDGLEKQSKQQSQHTAEHEQRRNELPVGDGVAHFLVDQWFPKAIMVVHLDHLAQTVARHVVHLDLRDDENAASLTGDPAIEFLVLVAQHLFIEESDLIENVLPETAEWHRVGLGYLIAPDFVERGSRAERMAGAQGDGVADG